MFVNLEKCQQKWDLSRIILSKIGQKKKRIAGKKNRWQNRLIPNVDRIAPNLLINSYIHICIPLGF